MDVFQVAIAVISHVCCKNILSVYVDVPPLDVHPASIKSIGFVNFMWTVYIIKMQKQHV